MSEKDLKVFFHEVRQAIQEGNEGRGPFPYHSGTFIVTATSGNVEVTIKDISEEDAALIAGELSELGAHVVVLGSQTCPDCGHRVPAQRYCTHCRSRLSP